MWLYFAAIAIQLEDREMGLRARGRDTGKSLQT